MFFDFLWWLFERLGLPEGGSYFSHQTALLAPKELLMTRAEKLVAGLTILLRYDINADFAAEHGELFFGSTPPDSIKREDLAALESYGFHFDPKSESWRKGA